MAKKLYKEEVLERLLNANPNFDYSEFEYINCEIKSKIICDKGHIFYKTFENFCNHSSCPECRKENKPKPNFTPLNEKDVLITLKILEPSYDFSNFKYKNNRTKSIIICDKGHQYEVSYDNFINGCRCPFCSGKYWNIEDVRKELQEIHPTYDFSQYEIEKKSDKGKVICNKGHIFFASYNSLKQGYRCSYCRHNRKKSLEEMIYNMSIKYPGFNFDYFNVNNTHEKGKIICPQGHEFEKCYKDIMGGKTCKICNLAKRGLSQRKPLDEVFKQLNEAEPSYDYSKFNYTGINNISTIICNNGHEFQTSFKMFVNEGNRCPHCCNHKSKPETEIINFIETFYNGEIQQSNRNIIKSARAKKEKNLS